MYFVCVYPGCKTLLPKIVACEGRKEVFILASIHNKKTIGWYGSSAACIHTVLELRILATYLALHSVLLSQSCP